MVEPVTLDLASPTPPASLDPPLRIKLSIMMFLQYAIWGAWWVVLVKYMVALKFSGLQIGQIYGTMAIASIISPMIFGQIADRWIPTQYLLAALHLAGGAVLYEATQRTDFATFYAYILVYALLYIPTISLSNSLSFHQISDAAKHFPSIRVFGTIGWIAAGLVVGMTLNEASTQPMLLACALSAIMGLFCFVLPHTPPSGKAGDAFPPLQAVGLLKDGTFALFILVSFVISTVLAAYYAFTADYLASIGINKAAAVMTTGQFAEMILLPFLPFFLRKLGMKWTLALGMAAWGIRYGIFSLGHPKELVIASLALHGICYDFFFVAAYIYVDNQARREIRASAQALFNLVTMGVGMYIGNIAFGRLVDAYKDPETGAVSWSPVWAYPAIGVVIALVIFIAAFREKKQAAAAFPA